MDRLYLRILCLLFVSLWFGVIAPGHQRGAIKLDGSEACDTTAAEASAVPAKPVTRRQLTSCCPLPSPPVTTDGKTDSDDQPPVDPASCCAVCYLNNILDTPEKPVFVTFCTGLLQELEPIEPPGLSSLLTTLLTHIRGPPALAC